MKRDVCILVDKRTITSLWLGRIILYAHLRWLLTWLAEQFRHSRITGSSPQHFVQIRYRLSLFNFRQSLLTAICFRTADCRACFFTPMMEVPVHCQISIAVRTVNNWSCRRKGGEEDEKSCLWVFQPPHRTLSSNAPLRIPKFWYLLLLYAL